MARARRLIWVVNHRTLLPAEIPIFRDLGYEVLIPKVIPDDPGMRSLVVTDEYDTTLSVPADVLDLLNRHNFYEGEWSPRLTSLLNEHFDVIVCTVSPYIAALAESARKFEGTLVARVFGREDPRTYTEFFALPEVADVLPALEEMGDRFVFGQGFDYLAAVETTQLSRRAHTITVPLPRSTYDYADTWRGDGDQLVLLCPEIVASPYYREIYDGIKRDFGDLPHVIFGRQTTPFADPAVLPYLTESGLYELYAGAPAFVYPSTEPRHVHYSPVEAMVVGAPVLYRRGALLDALAGELLPGACTGAGEMRAKAEALLAGDPALAADIRASQPQIVAAFSIELAQRQWRGALDGVGVRRTGRPS